MEPSFWRDRWAEGKIGFHEGHPNAFLARHLALLQGSRILVPLCGKTEDMAFLAAHGKRVIGVELVEDAVAAFFAEHAITPKVTTFGDLRLYNADDISIIAGDWFAVTAELVGTVDAIYDRAAVIALPLEMRAKYVAQLRTLVTRSTRGLLITCDYDAGQFTAPPHPVPDAEVRSLYDDVQLIEEGPLVGGRLGEANIGAIERCYSFRL